MSSRTSAFRRAAIGGSLVLLIVLFAVVVLDRADEDAGTDGEGAKPNGPQQTILYDADDRGAVFTRGSLMTGVTAGGRVKWRLRLTARDHLPYAVCTKACPQAEVGLGRDGSPVPETPDGPRLRFGPPDWRPAEARPRLRLDRPLLPGEVPLRVTMARPGGGASAALAGGKSIKLADTHLVPALAANRRVAVLGPRNSRRRRAYVLRRRLTGWALKTTLPVKPAADSVCISPGGSRIGLVGGGLPRVAEVGGGRSEPPRAVRGARRGEVNAGICALGRSVVATAVLSRGGEGSGKPAVVLNIHVRRRVNTIPLAGNVGGLWVSERTGTTAILLERKLLLIADDGRRKVWAGVDAATAAGAARLRVIPRRGRTYVRSF